MSETDYSSRQAIASSPRPRQEALKTFLLEMMVRRECRRQAAQAQELETHRIAEGIAFVRPVLEQIEGFTVEGFINPNDFDEDMGRQFSEEA